MSDTAVDIAGFGRVEVPRSNQRVLLVERPAGIPQARHFKIDTQPVSSIAEGEFLVRNIFLSVDPAQRGWASATANYSAPVEFGSPMRALSVGVVVLRDCP